MREECIQADEGFFFGLGAFETVCLKNGVPLLLDWHLERLAKSLDFLKIARRVEEAEVLEWLARQQIPALSALKIAVTGKNLLFLLRENPYTPERILRGFQVDFSPVRRNETSPLVCHKTLNYGDNILEKRRAAAAGLDEVLFLNGREEICEGSTTNVFFIKGDEIVTPPVESGLLPGVQRRFLLENLKIIQRPVFYAEAMEADEVFLTNSLMEIMPVTGLGGRAFGEHRRTLEIREQLLQK